MTMFLVGRENAFENFRLRNRIPNTDTGFVNIRRLETLQCLWKPGDRVVFLNQWQNLREWRAIYNWVLPRRQSLGAWSVDTMVRIERQWEYDLAALDAAARLLDRRRGKRS